MLLVGLAAHTDGTPYDARGALLLQVPEAPARARLLQRSVQLRCRPACGQQLGEALIVLGGEHQQEGQEPRLLLARELLSDVCNCRLGIVCLKPAEEKLVACRMPPVAS